VDAALDFASNIVDDDMLSNGPIDRAEVRQP
jgi:hypothetical protein